MSLLLSRYCTLLLPELQASEDSHGAFILRTWSSMSVLSIRFRYYMSAHEGPSSYSKSPHFGKFRGAPIELAANPVFAGTTTRRSDRAAPWLSRLARSGALVALIRPMRTSPNSVI